MKSAIHSLKVKFLLGLFVIAMLLPAGQRWIKAEVFDVSDLYTLVETGPIQHAHVDRDGNCILEEMTPPPVVFTAGEVIGWMTDYSQNRGVETTFTVSLNARREGSIKTTYVRDKGIIRADEKRSGPRNRCMYLPPAIPGGLYEIERTAVLKAEGRSAGSITLPTLTLRVRPSEAY